MRLSIRITLVSVFCIFATSFQRLLAQASAHQSNIIFYQVSTAQGLSDNSVFSLVVDKTGNLWIATRNGLNMFNGKTVSKFFSHDYPQMTNNNVVQVKCDNENRIWCILKGGSGLLIDENRQFHQINLTIDNKQARLIWLLQTAEQGIILFTSEGFFCLQDGHIDLNAGVIPLQLFTKIQVKGLDSLLKNGFRQAEPYDSNSYIFNFPEGFYKVDFKEKTVSKPFRPGSVRIMAKWGPEDLLIMREDTSVLQSINLVTGAISEPLRNVNDQYGVPFHSRVTSAKKINDEDLLLTTIFDGLYIFNVRTRQLFNYRHNAADPATIAINSPHLIETDNKGWVFLGSAPNGVSYFKSHAAAAQQIIFLDKQGNGYDGFVNAFATLDNDTYYLAGRGALLEWKRSTNTTKFINYTVENGRATRYPESVTTLAFDRLNRLWMAVRNRGLLLLDRNKNNIKRFFWNPNPGRNISPDFFWQIKWQPDGYMWLCGSGGVWRIDPESFAIDHFEHTPLEALKNVTCYETFFTDPDNVWISTVTKGLWHYTLSTKKLTNYSKANGFISDEVYCVNKDAFGNMYAGTSEGLYIFLPNGGSKRITDKQGLPNNLVETIMIDKDNRAWLGNYTVISCFNIVDTSLRVFDERYGLGGQGLRGVGACYQNSDGELFWGMERGIQYFNPQNLLKQKISLNTYISRVETSNHIYNLTRTATIQLPPSENSINFYFSDVDYQANHQTFYRYLLQGADAGWLEVTEQTKIRYTSLPPGSYHFKVQMSNDQKTWRDAQNEVTIVIAKHFWQYTWFRIAGVLFGLFLIAVVINFYRRRQKEQEEKLAAQVIISDFAARINSYQRAEDVLWDVAKNCISKLKFEDCVIYLLDAERNVLVQKAAFGPKLAKDFTIYQPIEIPVGKGIVGHVAKTGKPELIGNTTLDERYIVDDERRFSELTVPLIADEKIIGVIDSEHSRKNFFTQQHLSILSTIALLCANQIQRATAEEEKQKAKMEAMHNRQKVAESRLQSLRLQMNPHFLFNALNSIQQMILANEEMVATRYLSRFSKLLRTILIHSDKETVTLNEELEILNLYIELEAIRFKDSFHYQIDYDEQMDTDEIKLPTLLIQPFVENAIWHGLMHKESQRELKINFSESCDFLHCTIEDNGVGRKYAQQTKNSDKKDKLHVSKGIQVSMERLLSMRSKKGETGSLEIIDLHDENGKASGTRVQINFPLQN